MADPSFGMDARDGMDGVSFGMDQWQLWHGCQVQYPLTEYATLNDYPGKLPRNIIFIVTDHTIIIFTLY
jgi:hypothetical protein